MTVFSTPGHARLTDIELKSPDLVRYLGTIGTPEMLREIIDKGDEAAPFWMSDLIIVDELTEDSIVHAARQLIVRGELEQALQRVTEEDAPGRSSPTLPNTN